MKRVFVVCLCALILFSGCGKYSTEDNSEVNNMTSESAIASVEEPGIETSTEEFVEAVNEEPQASEVVFSEHFIRTVAHGAEVEYPYACLISNYDELQDYYLRIIIYKYMS